MGLIGPSLRFIPLADDTKQFVGIDHIRIAVRDLESAKDQYRDVLGFTLPPKGKKGIHPTGSENSSIDLGDSYLELIAVHDKEKVLQKRPWLIEFLNKREGAQSLGILVSSAEQTAKSLRSRGFLVTDPVPGSIMREGDKEPPPPQWWLVDFQRQPIAGCVIFFIEYAHASDLNEPRRPPEQPNTCQRFEATWFVVDDLKQASENCNLIGFRSKRSLDLARLGAVGQEFDTGNGSIMLIRSNSPTGNVEAFRKQAGEGIMGISLGVKSLKTAGDLLESTTRRQYPTYRGPYGESIVIPGSLANGVWIEMFERH